MVWITKSFSMGAEWAADQDKFADLQLGVAAQGGDTYLKLIMALVDHDDGSESIYLSLPSKEFIALFPGYDLVKAAMPKVASLLVGSQTEFENHFSFPQFGD